jgi:prevent-host-death family protein
VRLPACLCRVAGTALTFPVLEARDHLAELVARARHGHERVVLTEKGEPAAVLSRGAMDALRDSLCLQSVALRPRSWGYGRSLRIRVHTVS